MSNTDTATDIDPQRRLGDLVADHPQYASVFESFGIDYCCGGDTTLAAACETHDLDLDTVQERLADTQADTDAGIEWETPTELVDGIVETHHEYLREELPELRSIVETVAHVHGDDHPELREVESVFDALADEMLEHITDEEEGGFPVIRSLDAGEPLSAEDIDTLRTEIDAYETDHDETAARLDRLAELTNGYEVPDDACASYRAMLDRLEALERDTHMHVHRENNVLFPAAEDLLAAET